VAASRVRPTSDSEEKVERELDPDPEGIGERVPAPPRRRAERGGGGGGGSRTRVRKRACERPYRFSPTWCFAPIVKARRNRPRLVRLISPVAPGPRASSQPTFVTLCPTAVGG